MENKEKISDKRRKALKKLMIDKDIRSKDIAIALGLKQSNLCFYLNGRYRKDPDGARFRQIEEYVRSLPKTKEREGK